MVNTEIRKFRESIISTTNDSPLPIEIKRLVFAEVMTQINEEAQRVLAAELQEAERQKVDEESKQEESEVEVDGN